MKIASTVHKKKIPNSQKLAGSSSPLNVWLAKVLNKTASESINEILFKYPKSCIIYLEALAKNYQKNGKFLDSALCYKELVVRREAAINDLINLSVVLFMGGEMLDSLTYARMAYVKDSKSITTTKVFLECLISTNHPQEALDIALEKLKESPADIDLRVAVAQSKRLLGDWEGAIEILNELSSHTNEFKYSLMLADAIGEIDSGKALPIYEKALLNGELFSPIFHYNLSLHYLRTRQFKKGWPLYEFGLDREVGLYGRKVPYNLKGMYRADLAQDSDPSDLTVVCWEQGIGDQLVCLSAIEEAMNDFPNMVLVCEGRMASIISRSFPNLQLSTGGNFGGSSFGETGQKLGYMPLGSMLAKYRPNTESFLVNRKPFIAVDADLYYFYRDRLKQLSNGRKILGISWQSNVAAANTAKIKGTQFSDWLGIFNKNTLIVNLQYGNTLTEQDIAKTYNLEMVSFNELDFTKELDHWLALSAACDGITCISTSLVHFSGACGQKVAVVMPYNQGHWSLGVSDDESIIYPNVRLFRKQQNESTSLLIQRASDHITKDLS